MGKASFALGCDLVTYGPEYFMINRHLDQKLDMETFKNFIPACISIASAMDIDTEEG